MDVFEIIAELEQRERQIEEKLHKITSVNLHPFPMDRIQKGKLLLKLIYEFKKHVEADEFILAGTKETCVGCFLVFEFLKFSYSLFKVSAGLTRDTFIV